jgi:hypothetical protein
VFGGVLLQLVHVKLRALGVWLPLSHLGLAKARLRLRLARATILR